MAGLNLTDEALDNEEDTEQLETSTVEATPVAPAADPVGGDVDAGAGQPAFSAETLDLAGRYGLDPEDYKDEAAFYRAVARQDRATMEWQRSRESQSRQPSNIPAEKKETAQQALKRLEFEKLFPKTADGEIDPAIVAACKAMDDHYHGLFEGTTKELAELRALKAEFEEHKQFRQSEEQRRFVQEWDTFFSGVGDDFKDKVGTGSQGDVSQNQLLLRDNIVQTALALKQVDIDRGFRPLSDKQYGQRALLSVIGPAETNAIARKDILNKAKKRSGAALNGANGRTAPTLDPRERAWQKFQEIGKKVGVYDNDED